MYASLNKAHHRWLAIVLAVFVLYTIGRFGIDQIRPPGLIPNDYMNFHHASDRLAAHEQIYQAGDASPFKYSPTFLLFFRYTFDLLPRTVAWAVWCTISIAGFAWATYWLWLAAGLTYRLPRRVFLALVVAAGICGWHGYIEHFSYGQGDMILYALFIAAVAATPKLSGDLLSGALMSLLLIAKPQAGILLAYFLVCRRWRMLAATGAGTFALLLAPALGWGFARQIQLFGEWWVVLSQQSTEFLTGNLNQSVAATAARWLGNRALVGCLTTLAVASGALAAVVLTLAWPRAAFAAPRNHARMTLTTLLMYAVVSPLSWRWFTFLWLPAGVALAVDALAVRPRPRLQLALLVAFALTGTLLQTFVAHALGIAEVDDLSRLGFYTLGNCLLFTTACLSLHAHRNENDVSS
ncbi:MAG: DUF2029 domain-containing protein [Deltaproteobacteria bacterium]|nr:DUF2029 domain-containing protein [Deltaproteobacteria bacterium]